MDYFPLFSKLDIVYELTNHECDPSGLKSAIENVASVGKSLIDETFVFSDTLMDLSERQDDLAVAKK